MATGDLHNTGSATDNYIEKYLPFELQKLISENMLSVLKRPLFNNKKKIIDMKPEDIKNLEVYKKFRSSEFGIYKKLHDRVIDDHGVPNLNKRQYNMPGYTEVFKADERVAYDLEPMEESESEYEEPDIFVSKDLRAKLNFKRHKK
jgi:hypothetical protein